MRLAAISAFEEVRADEYAEAIEAREIGLLWIGVVEAHSHLRTASIGYIFRDEEITTGGRVEAASAHLASLRGAGAKHWGRFLEWAVVGMIGYQPDFIILIDRNIWNGLDGAQKCALIDHELSHCQQTTDFAGNPRFNQVTGQPIWRIVAHDIEEFNGVIERNGLWSGDLTETARAIVNALSSKEPTIGQQLADEIAESAKDDVA